MTPLNHLQHFEKKVICWICSNPVVNNEVNIFSIHEGRADVSIFQENCSDLFGKSITPL